MTTMPPALKPGQLRAYTPFASFTPESLIVAAGQVETLELTAGERILGLGADDPNDYYLVNGELLLTDPDGGQRTVTMGDPDAARAIAPLRPSVYEVTAAGYARCFAIPRFVVEILAQTLPDEGATVEDLTNEVTQTREFFADFERDLAARRVALPACPDLAKTIRKAVESHKHSAKDVARIVGVDPAIAAKILKIANSPIFRGNRPIELLADAVVRIGMHTVAELVICFTLRDVIRTDDPKLKLHFRRNLEEAVNVAALCETIAARTEHPDRDAAMVAGLLHNVGLLPILAYATQHPAYVHNFELIKKAARGFTGEVGRQLAVDWALSERYQRAIAHGRDLGYAPEDGSDLTALVVAARYLFLGRRHGYDVLPAPGEVPSLVATLGDGFDVSDGEAINEAARASVVALQDLMLP